MNATFWWVDSTDAKKDPTDRINRWIQRMDSTFIMDSTDLFNNGFSEFNSGGSAGNTVGVTQWG
jgi:hypothetical protein